MVGTRDPRRADRGAAYRARGDRVKGKRKGRARKVGRAKRRATEEGRHDGSRGRCGEKERIREPDDTDGTDSPMSADASPLTLGLTYALHEHHHPNP